MPDACFMQAVMWKSLSSSYPIFFLGWNFDSEENKSDAIINATVEFLTQRLRSGEIQLPGFTLPTNEFPAELLDEEPKTPAFQALKHDPDTGRLVVPVALELKWGLFGPCVRLWRELLEETKNALGYSSLLVADVIGSKKRKK